MTRKSDLTRRANEQRAERLQVSAALARTPESKPHAWKSTITPADVRTGREYERAAIAAAERESARRRGDPMMPAIGDREASTSPADGAGRCTWGT